MAGQACELIYCNSVTGSAGCTVMIQKILSECCGVIPCKDRRNPTGSVVTLYTVRSECTRMKNRFCMTECAIRWDLELTR